MKSLPTISMILVLLVVTAGKADNRQHVETPPEPVSFSTEDGGLIYANVYGKGDRGIVLAHGGRFNKESWEPQARALVKVGFCVLAFDFRGYGKSHGSAQSALPDEGRRFDVLAAVRYVRKQGSKTLTVIGASMGGDFAAEAAELAPKEIDGLVLLASGAYTPVKKMKGRKLFIMCRDDFMGDDKKPRYPQIRRQYEQAAEPKEMVLLEGSAHAQFIFATDQGGRLLNEIIRFLSAR